jgi:hypothetical protein
MNNTRQVSDAKWVKALRKELAIVRAKANQPRPKGVSRETWEGLTAPYKAEVLMLRSLLSQFDKRS